MGAESTAPCTSKAGGQLCMLQRANRIVCFDGFSSYARLPGGILLSAKPNTKGKYYKIKRRLWRISAHLSSWSGAVGIERTHQEEARIYLFGRRTY